MVILARVRPRSRKGSGMLIALFVLTLIIALGASFLMLSSSSLITAKRDTIRARALSAAEAGLDEAISRLMAVQPGETYPGTWRTSHPSSEPDVHSDDTWYEGALGTDESYKVCCRDGTGINAGKIIVTSVGTATRGNATISRTVKAVLNLSCENVNVWSNVIFGGVGQAGKSINGNVKIRGSVHLLGDGEQFTDLDADGRWDNNEPYTDTNGNGIHDASEPYTDVDGDGHRDAREPFDDVNGSGSRDPALTVTDLATEVSGTANIGNNYNGMSQELRNLLPTPPTESFGGESVESLDTKLRVKHGKVNVSGSATVGDPNWPSNSLKETVRATYVNDGFGGNQGTTSVYSDNGYATGYDLGDGVVSMPVIDSGQYTKDGVTYPNYLQYLNANATVYTGDLTINKGTAVTINGPKGSLSIDADGNMTITGIVYVTGNISFGPAKSRIIYDGNGTLVSPASMFVHCDLLPKGKFPTDDALGLCAGDRIELATGGGDAQLKMAIAMYAQHKVTSVKQSEIAGTIVGSYFQMSNVPSIFQAPELANHLPPGLPGSDPIWIASISVESWQEVP